MPSGWGLCPLVPIASGCVKSLSYTRMLKHVFQFKHFRFLTLGLMHSPFSAILIKCQTRPRLLIIRSTISLPHKKFLSQKFLMTSLRMICGLPLTQLKILATIMQGGSASVQGWTFAAPFFLRSMTVLLHCHVTAAN